MIKIPDESSFPEKVTIPDDGPPPIRRRFSGRIRLIVAIIAMTVLLILIFFVFKPSQPQTGWVAIPTINLEVDFYGQWYYEDDDMNFVALVATAFKITPTNVPTIANKNPDFVFDVYTSGSSSATARVKLLNRANTLFIVLPDQSIGRFRLSPGEARKLQQAVEQSSREVSLVRTLSNKYTGPDQGKLRSFLNKYHEPPSELSNVNAVTRPTT